MTPWSAEPDTAHWVFGWLRKHEIRRSLVCCVGLGSRAYRLSVKNVSSQWCNSLSLIGCTKRGTCMPLRPLVNPLHCIRLKCCLKQTTEMRKLSMFIDSALSRLHAYVEHMTQSAASLHKPVRVPVFCYAAGDRCVGRYIRKRVKSPQHSTETWCHHADKPAMSAMSHTGRHNGKMTLP